MITDSAILKEGKIYTGRRHHNCIKSVVQATGVRPAGGKQGFVDNKGNFLDRVDALNLALECGQIKEPKIRLYSEDLW